MYSAVKPAYQTHTHTRRTHVAHMMADSEHYMILHKMVRTRDWWLPNSPDTVGRTKSNQVRPSTVTAVYPHMPIIRVAREHARVACTIAVQRAYARSAAMARATRAIRRPISGFWGSFWVNIVPQNGRFPALDTDEPPCKI